MADCGICLDALRGPVSVPCGHIHCERCLRAHISAGADALRSTCPTCRKSFHIATPDFTFVPQKYHDFILPSVRKLYMDIPSVTGLTGEMNLLSQRVDALVKENDQLRQHYADYRDRLKNMESDRRVILRREEEARQEADELQKKYQSLKRRYRQVTRDEYSTASYSQDLDTPQEIFPKEEEHPVSLQDVKPNLTRPKRPLPKSRLSYDMQHHKDDKEILLVKRQRIQRHPGVGPSSQTQRIVFKSEDEDEE